MTSATGPGSNQPQDQPQDQPQGPRQEEPEANHSFHTEASFGGVIGTTIAESTPWFPPPISATGQPNIVMIVLDDTGFGHLGCYGSSLRSPHIDALARGGLKYTNFHTTSLCSPTRACLMTGHNHHSVGMRGISNWNTGFPHMTGRIPKHVPTVAQRLQQHGYVTLAAGKWHLTPMEDGTAAGPFDQWPLQRGFDRYYGFLQGETDQFSPELTRDNHHVDPPAHAGEGYHVSEDIVSESIGWLHDVRSFRPDRPFFLYLAFGAMHAPHHAPQEYLKRWRGAFDEGYDIIRERWFETQKELGIIPEDTNLCDPNPGVPSWDSLSVNEQKFAARLQEAFAAMLEHTDDQIGRLVHQLEQLNCREDTVIMLLSDNGASQEGGPRGVFNEWSFFNGVDEGIESMPPEQLDQIGGPLSYPNIPWGWAQAGNTPLRWYKQNTYGGGLRTPLIVNAPKLINPQSIGETRTQFCHAIDLAATVLDIAGLDGVTPGVAQMAGRTILPTLNDPHSGPVRPTQYFEQLGHRGIFHDGWKATTYHEQGTPFEDDKWELFDLSTDFSETVDLSEKFPEKLSELIELWWSEAHKFGVLPLDDRTLELFLMEPRPTSPHAAGVYRFLPPVSQLPADACPRFGGQSYLMTAAIECQTPRGTIMQQPEGIIFARGSRTLGQCLWLRNGVVQFSYHGFGHRTLLRGPVEFRPGMNHLELEYERSNDPAPPAGTLRLKLNGEVLDEALLPRIVLIFGAVGMSIGQGPFNPIVPELQGPFPFSGNLREVTFARMTSNPADTSMNAGATNEDAQTVHERPSGESSSDGLSPTTEDQLRYGAIDLSRE